MPKRKRKARRTSATRRLTQPSIPLLLGTVALILLFAGGFGQWDFQQFEAQFPQAFYAEEDGIYKVLDFGPDTVTYRLETEAGTTPVVVGTYPYEVVASGKIKLCRYGREFESVSLSFHQNGTMLTISPALTVTAHQETFSATPPSSLTE